MNKAVKIALKISNTLILTIIVVLAMALVGIKLFGIQMFNVLSGSMEPAYPVGSLIFVKDVEPDTLTEGDVITFHLTGGTPATHRIVEVIPDETDAEIIWYRTKGDANEDVDAALTSSEELIGQAIAVVPRLGEFADRIQNPPGKYAVWAFGGAALLFVFVTDSVLSEDKKKKRQEGTGSSE